MRTTELNDEEWKAVVSRIRIFILQSGTLTKAAQKINLSAPTLRRVAKGERPSFLAMLKIMGWDETNAKR